MPTPYEKQFEARLRKTERELREIRAFLGMEERESLEMERQDAIDLMVEKGDPSLIKMHLIKINQRETTSA